MPIYDGERLRAGDHFVGPAIIEETTTTVVIPVRYDCTVDAYRNYVLTREGSSARPAAAGAPVEAAVAGGIA